MNESKFSEFYLERVGHEVNERLSKQLKEGKNLIGRDVKEEHIEINSLHCSRRHCVITVSGNSVELEALNVRFYILSIENRHYIHFFCRHLMALLLMVGR